MRSVPCVMSAALFIVASVAAPVRSVNWFRLQGVEDPGSGEPVRVWGVLQPTYYSSEDRTDPFDDYMKDDFVIRRARFGARGVLPETDGRVNYFLLMELGRNGVTFDPNGLRSNPAVLTDASVTLSYLPGARFRFGQFKLPIGVEGLQSVTLFTYIEFSDVYDNLLVERFGLDRSAGAFRDIGVEVFDWWEFGADGGYEAAYALASVNGNGINSQDNDDAKDTMAKVTFARVFGKSEGARRQEVQAGAWYVDGRRTGYAAAPGPANGPVVARERDRFGAELVVNRDLGRPGSLRVIGESVWGDGWVYAPSFFGGAVPPERRYFTQNASVDGHGVPHADLEAWGWYLDLGWRLPVVSRRLELDLRYSFYDPDRGGALGVDVSEDTWTYGLQYFFNRTSRIAANYEVRRSGWDPSLDDRFMAQVTAVFP